MSETRLPTTMVSNRVDPSMICKPGKEIPILKEKNFSLWKEHVLAYVRSTNKRGSSDIPEALSDPVNPRGKEAKDI